MRSSTTHHLRDFALVAVTAWTLGTPAFTYLYPQFFYKAARRAVVNSGLGIKPGGIPVNTLYATPALASPSLSKSPWVLTGNRDGLYTVGGLDLGAGPQTLHVPDMAGRCYSIVLVDPRLEVFAVVSRRATGTGAGDYLITGPAWQGTAPEGVTRIASPSNSVMLLGRVLVEGDGDVSTAYDLTKRIQLTPLAIRQPNQ
jgi:hypothetical protein